MISTKKFALIDCNNFYASCEQVFDPKLRNQPLIVLSNNDGCIISRSQEAKKLGIQMGKPLFKIPPYLKKQLHIRSSNYALYGDLSQRIISTLETFTDKVETYSIDEAFIEIPAHITPTEIRETIYRHTGIPVSIGISNTKTKAKIANELAKKSPHHQGIFELPATTQPDFFKQIAIEDIWGVGYSNAEKLRIQGIRTAFDLMQKDDNWIRKKLTINGLRTVFELRGISCFPLEESHSDRKNINVSRSFGIPVKTLAHLQEAISTYAAQAAAKLRKEQKTASFIYVYLKTNRFNRHEKYFKAALSLDLPSPTNNSSEIITAAKQLMKQLFQPNRTYQKCGLTLMGLTPETHHQQNLIITPTPQIKTLMKKVDRLNKKFGRETIQFAATGTKKSWRMKSNFRSPAYTTNWAEIPKVLAN